MESLAHRSVFVTRARYDRNGVRMSNRSRLAVPEDSIAIALAPTATSSFIGSNTLGCTREMKQDDHDRTHGTSPNRTNHLEGQVAATATLSDVLGKARASHIRPRFTPSRTSCFWRLQVRSDKLGSCAT